MTSGAGPGDVLAAFRTKQLNANTNVAEINELARSIKQNVADNGVTCKPIGSISNAVSAGGAPRSVYIEADTLPGVSCMKDCDIVGSISPPKSNIHEEFH